jgi:hypothetical protein
MAKGKTKKKFRVLTEFVFTGDFIIKARSRQEAYNLVKKYAGMTMSNGVEFDPTTEAYKKEGSVDWEFDSHAEMRITHT